MLGKMAWRNLTTEEEATRPEARQGGIYPVRGAGYQIRPERAEAEARMAAALQASLFPTGRNLQLIYSDTKTPFYLSLFACAFPQPPSPMQDAARAVRARF